jgi:hypothetical protein
MLAVPPVQEQGGGIRAGDRCTCAAAGAHRRSEGGAAAVHAHQQHQPLRGGRRPRQVTDQLDGNAEFCAQLTSSSVSDSYHVRQSIRCAQEGLLKQISKLWIVFHRLCTHQPWGAVTV